MPTIGLKKQLGCGYDDALGRVTAALKAEGFGVLTTVDVKQTLKEKLNVDFRRYTILGACNPPIAHSALSLELAFGTMMPCNVVVYEGDDAKAVVIAVDPTQSIAMQLGPQGVALATQVRDKLAAALEKVS